MPDGNVGNPRRGPRWVGYVIGAGVNAALLYIVNVQPGWERVPFLTDDTVRVLGLVNLSLAVGMLANVVYAIADSWWVKDIGDILTTTVGLVALMAIWRVYPFDFSQSANDWSWFAKPRAAGYGGRQCSGHRR